MNIQRRDAQLVQIVDAALADATLRAGPHLACRPGCTQCCHGAFAINQLDAMRLRRAMVDLAISHPEQAATIATRAARYLAEFSHEFPGDPMSGVLGTSPEEEAAFEEFANDAPCPSLNPENGLCDLYMARPTTCRVFGPPVRARGEDAGNNEADDEADNEGLAVCELCFTEASEAEIAAAEMKVPYDEEQSLLDDLQQAHPGSDRGDTIVAYCLTLQQSAELQTS